MNIKDAKEIAHRWVLEEASNQVGFQGAFYHGSTNWLSDDAILPTTSDLDIMVVFADPPPVKLGKFIYQDVMLEVSYWPADQLQSPEQVLGNYVIAGSFHGPSVIADPSGRLTELQAIVSTEYAKRKWVHKRCEHARQKVQNRLQQVGKSTPLYHQVTVCAFAAGVTTHILLVAGLENPTVRRRYMAVRELLERYDRLDFYETLLDMLGCAQMSRKQAEGHLAALSAVFDVAKTVVKPPYQFAADISDHGRPVANGGSQELIERGYHREAIFWMVATYSRCQDVLSQNAALEVQEQFHPGYHALLTDLGISSFADRQRRREQIEGLLPRVWKVAEEIMGKNPQIEE